MFDIIVFVATAVLSVVCLYMYFPVARKNNMLAGVNHRSSHHQPVVTGAGFIFVLSVVGYFVLLLCKGEPFPWFFALGFLLLAGVSFLDDIRDVWFLYRLLFQVAALCLMMLQLSVDFGEGLGESLARWLAIICMMIYVLGTVNLYNFMDGINGMMGCMTIAVLVPALLIDLYVVEFIDEKLIIYTLLPTLIFLFFNFRNKPLCFSGDVGSVTVGFIISYVILSLLIATGNVVYVFLLAVVYVEAGLTVMQRLFAGQNIFKPHRIHLFQLLCNERSKNHLAVSSFYAGVQLIFGLLIFMLNYFEVESYIQISVCVIIFVVMCVAYLLVKRRMMDGHLLHLNDKFVKQCSE